MCAARICAVALVASGAAASSPCLNGAGQAIVTEFGAVASTTLDDCRQERAPVARPLREGIEVVRWLTHEPSGRAVVLSERFMPHANGLRWEIDITSDGPAWTTDIHTHLAWPLREGDTFWTAWGSPEPDQIGWLDPLQPMPFRDLSLRYGGASHASADAVCLPIATALRPAVGRGLSLVLSPEDLSLDTVLTTSASGSIEFTRSRYRLGEGRTVRFAIDLVSHAADWRSALGWLVRRYPSFFEPANPRAHEIAGLGAYSTDEGDLDARRFAQMGFMVNWKASYDFPYMGMFLPPVDDTTSWNRFGPGEASIAQLQDYSRRMEAQGFHVLSYFNVTEFGARLTFPPPPRSVGSEEDLWRSADDFLHHAIPGAVLYTDGRQPYWSWEGAIATDCGDPDYAAFLLDQARRHVAKLPDADGICIDRMDWLRLYNPFEDDGVSLVEGKPARSLVTSWLGLMARLGPIMHDADKVIFVNPHDRRLSLQRHVDGIYDEFGNMPHGLNLCALLGLRKPVIEWTASTEDLRPDPDAMFQRALYLGVFPTAPLPANDHTINPDPWADPYYLDYGPLFDALRGRTWVLEADPVSVVGGGAKANLFHIPGGYCAPVVLGGPSERAELLLRGLRDLTAVADPWVEVIHPGETEWRPLPHRRYGATLRLTVPLLRGCAMVRVLHTRMTPDQRCFLGEAKVEINTRVPGAAVRCTLDGSEPTVQSPAITAPLALTRTTPIRAAVFVGERRMGPILARTYVNAPLSAPTVSADPRIFTDRALVTMTPAPGSEAAGLHYTLDGSEPDAESPKYGLPFEVTADCVVRARSVTTAGDLGRIGEIELRRLPSAPPEPDVPLPELEPLVATSGWGGEPRRNASIQGNPLTVAGRTWASGIGTHAHSELRYALRPEFQRFVATVGIDDEMRDYDLGSIVFRVLFSGTVAAESPVLRQGEWWHFDVAIPIGASHITLVADGTSDGINCDHADWAGAGFVR